MSYLLVFFCINVCLCTCGCVVALCPCFFQCFSIIFLSFRCVGKLFCLSLCICSGMSVFIYIYIYMCVCVYVCVYLCWYPCVSVSFCLFGEYVWGSLDCVWACTHSRVGFSWKKDQEVLTQRKKIQSTSTHPQLPYIKGFLPPTPHIFLSFIYLFFLTFCTCVCDLLCPTCLRLTTSIIEGLAWGERFVHQAWTGMMCVCSKRR